MDVVARIEAALLPGVKPQFRWRPAHSVVTVPNEVRHVLTVVRYVLEY